MAVENIYLQKNIIICNAFCEFHFVCITTIYYVLLFRRFFRHFFSDELFYTSCFSSLQTNFLCQNNCFNNSFVLMVSTAIVSIYLVKSIIFAGFLLEIIPNRSMSNLKSDEKSGGKGEHNK